VTGLKYYRVRLVETEGRRSRFAFDCQADDSTHAIEQATNAYPDARCIRLQERATANIVAGGREENIDER
jgi:hypothetical protein